MSQSINQPPEHLAPTFEIDYFPDDPDLIRTVATWIHREWAHLNPGRRLFSVEQRLERRSRSRQVPLSLLARDGEHPIGTASLIESDMDRRRDLSPWMSAVLVRPENRGQGVGAALCRRIEAEARRLGLAKIYLFTEDRENFYAHLGWVVEERCEYRGRSVVVMRRALEGELLFDPHDPDYGHVDGPGFAGGVATVDPSDRIQSTP